MTAARLMPAVGSHSAQGPKSLVDTARYPLHARLLRSGREPI